MFPLLGGGSPYGKPYRMPFEDLMSGWAKYLWRKLAVCARMACLGRAPKMGKKLRERVGEVSRDRSGLYYTKAREGQEGTVSCLVIIYFFFPLCATEESDLATKRWSE